MIDIEISKIPENFKQESNYYKTLVNDCDYLDTINIPSKFANFDETVNNYNDIKRIISLYRFWFDDTTKLFDLVYNNKEIIKENLIDFIRFNNDFELSESFVILLKPLTYIHKDIFEKNNVYLLEYLCKKDLINIKFIGKNLDLNLVRILKKYNYIIPYETLLDYGIKLDNNNSIEYLEYLWENYRGKITNKMHRFIHYCCLHKKGCWVIYFLDLKEFDFEANINITFDEIYEWGYKYSNNEDLLLKLVTENYVKTDTVQQIIDVIINPYCNSYNLVIEEDKSIDCDYRGNSLIDLSKILTYIFTKKISLDYVLPLDEIEIKCHNDLNEEYGNNEDNITFSKLLQLVFLHSDNMSLLDWLIKNGIEKSYSLLDSAINWVNYDIIVWMCDNGFQPDKYSLWSAIKSKGVKTTEYFINKGFKLTYEMLDAIYNLLLMCIDNYFARHQDGKPLLKYLVPNENYKIDNRYIIRSLENYRIFSVFYENYPDIVNILLNEEDNEDLINKYINMYNNKIVCKDKLKYDELNDGDGYIYPSTYEDEEIKHNFTGYNDKVIKCTKNKKPRLDIN